MTVEFKPHDCKQCGDCTYFNYDIYARCVSPSHMKNNIAPACLQPLLHGTFGVDDYDTHTHRRDAQAQYGPTQIGRFLTLPRQELVLPSLMTVGVCTHPPICANADSHGPVLELVISRGLVFSPIRLWPSCMCRNPIYKAWVLTSAQVGEHTPSDPHVWHCPSHPKKSTVWQPSYTSSDGSSITYFFSPPSQRMRWQGRRLNLRHSWLKII